MDSSDVFDTLDKVQGLYADYVSVAEVASLAEVAALVEAGDEPEVFVAPAVGLVFSS